MAKRVRVNAKHLQLSHFLPDIQLKRLSFRAQIFQFLTDVRRNIGKKLISGRNALGQQLVPFSSEWRAVKARIAPAKAAQKGRFSDAILKSLVDSSTVKILSRMKGMYTPATGHLNVLDLQIGRKRPRDATEYLEAYESQSAHGSLVDYRKSDLIKVEKAIIKHLFTHWGL